MNWISVSLFLLIVSGSAARGDVSVFAAASTTETMRELAAAYTAGGRTNIRFNFAGSGALARQIDAGAPADIFVSANSGWMDWLEEKGRIESASRFDLAANTLVMIAPKGSPLRFDGTIDGRLAVGDFKSVPAGMYAEEALSTMGWLDIVRPNLAMSPNVRTVLLYVEHGEVAAGIVYATDAQASDKACIIGIFPSDSHSRIVYPVAAVSKKEGTSDFLAFLKSDTARQILKRHGFK